MGTRDLLVNRLSFDIRDKESKSNSQMDLETKENRINSSPQSRVGQDAQILGKINDELSELQTTMHVAWATSFIILCIGILCITYLLIKMKLTIKDQRQIIGRYICNENYEKLSEITATKMVQTISKQNMRNKELIL